MHLAQEKIKDMLIENGMFDGQADQVLDLLIDDLAARSMTGRWNDDIEGYHSQLLAVIWRSARRIALGWIDENLPQAWFRPMFVD